MIVPYGVVLGGLAGGDHQMFLITGWQLTQGRQIIASNRFCEFGVS
ncbi:hypothetical protein OAH34_01910 [bacterium]|nr:hypothetical protein [bacterium]